MPRAIAVIKAVLPAVCGTVLLAACQGGGNGTPSASATPASQSTATAAAPRSLTICMGEEPASLYLYGGGGLAARTVLEAVYDGPIDTLEYSNTPVILESLPTLENHGAALQPVTVQAGGRIFDDAGAPAALVPGVKYRPSGCTESSCVATYADGNVTMDQLVVTFKLKSGLRWSDGQPLTADDSVYSYELSTSPDTPAPAGLTRAIAGTQAYEAVDDLTVRWTGLPGDMDPGYSQRFWTPVPRHAWGGMKPADLLTADASARTPIGWGPYVIESWDAGKSISLKKNPYYFRADEGLPKFDNLQIRFVGADGALGISALLSGECDLVDQTVRLDDQIPMLVNLQESGQLQAGFTTGTAWEHIDFNLDPVAGYGKKYLQDPRLRQAIAYCLDRQKVVADALGGLSAVPNTYLPPQHPLYNKDAAAYPFDTKTGEALLDSIGWKDLDGDANTPRTAAGVAGVANGTPLQLNITMIDTTLRHQVMDILGTGLTECGIGLLATFSDNTIFVPASDGLIFGRQYEASEFGWIGGIAPPCELYTTDEIPSAANGWKGTNVTGFSNPAYDQACDLARRSLPGTAAYTDNQLLAQKIFAENLPSIPLFLTVKAAAARTGFIGLELDPTAADDLYNLENFDIPAAAAQTP